MAKPRTSAAVKNRYAAKAYDRVSLIVPKGRKMDIEEHAKNKGESVNSLINGLLRADMGLTEADWKKNAEETTTEQQITVDNMGFITYN